MTKHETLIDGVLVDFDTDHEPIDLDALETIADWNEDLQAKISTRALAP